jgi:hypothetical protein
MAEYAGNETRGTSALPVGLPAAVEAAREAYRNADTGVIAADESYEFVLGADALPSLSQLGLDVFMIHKMERRAKAPEAASPSYRQGERRDDVALFV